MIYENVIMQTHMYSKVDKVNKAQWYSNIS